MIQEHLDGLTKIRLDNRGLAFAFDHMEQEGHIQRTLQMCRDAGIGKSRIMVYILYNFNDAPQEAEYRAREVIKFERLPPGQDATNIIPKETETGKSTVITNKKVMAGNNKN